MGGGKDQKTANKQITQQTNYQTGQQQAFDTRNTADLNSSRTKGDELYNSLKAGYEGQVGANATGGGSGGSGGYQLPAWDSRFQKVEDQYENFMKTGGWDDATKQAQQGRIDSLTEMGKTGGVDAEAQNRIRGNGVYDEFSKTGGLSDKDRANMRTRGTSGISAMYDRVRSEQNRGAAISGGYGPGRAVLASRMARDQSRNAAEASLNTELGITDAVNKGRQWGTAGMTSSETGLQDLLTKNKLQGLTGANADQLGMQQSIMGGQQWGTQGYQGIVGEQQQRADTQASINASASAQGSANDKWAQEFNARQKAAGLEGLNSLYSGSGSGEYNTNKDFALQSAGTYGDQVQGGGQNLKTNNQSAWDTAAKFAGAGAGLVTGLGNMGYGTNKNKPQATA